MATTLLKCYSPFLPFHLSSKRIINGGMLAKNPVLVRSFHFKVRFHCFCSKTTLSNSHSGSKPLIDESGSTKESAKGQLWLYNTMSRQKELFKSQEPGKVGMYVCGVTAYDLSHIGHARVYVSFDVLYRYLKFMGYEVNYVRNFTDVDDKVGKILDFRTKEIVESDISLPFSL